MSELVESIRERYLQVMDKIAGAARGAGRDPSGIRLVVVTKTQSVEIVRAAIEAGVIILGRTIRKRVS